MHAKKGHVADVPEREQVQNNKWITGSDRKARPLEISMYVILAGSMPPKNNHFAWLGDILHKIAKTVCTVNVHCNKLSTK